MLGLFFEQVELQKGSKRHSMYGAHMNVTEDASLCLCLDMHISLK